VGDCGRKWDIVVIQGSFPRHDCVLDTLDTSDGQCRRARAGYGFMSSLEGFIGTHSLRLDDKNRLTIPARFKVILQENFPSDGMQVVMSAALDPCLIVQPSSGYRKMMEKYLHYSDLDEAARRLQELMTGLASAEKVDGSGRIRLTPDLRQYAGIDRDVTCVGRLDFFQIWDRAAWEKRQAETLRDREALTRQLRGKTE
jgi:MraZ protein